MPDAMNVPVKATLVRKRGGSESTYWSYRCERGEAILVEVETDDGFDTIREEAYDSRCEECCRFSGDWDGSLSIRQAMPCWKDAVR